MGSFSREYDSYEFWIDAPLYSRSFIRVLPYILHATTTGIQIPAKKYPAWHVRRVNYNRTVVDWQNHEFQSQNNLYEEHPYSKPPLSIWLQGDTLSTASDYHCLSMVWGKAIQSTLGITRHGTIYWPCHSGDFAPNLGVRLTWYASHFHLVIPLVPRCAIQIPWSICIQGVYVTLKVQLRTREGV